MGELPLRAEALASGSPTRRLTRTYLCAKRAMDLVGSALLLLLLSPLFLLIALAIQLESPGTVFFAQRRLGRMGRYFGLYKFRTLRRKPTSKDLAGSHMALSGNDSDITRLGRILRHSGLNELPQLINILRGEMSFIGPRPAVLHHEQYYTDWHRRRLEVTPGVTGLAQVCGRNAIPWGWRVALDRYYVDHASLTLDWLIFWKTFYVVLCGIGAEGDEQLYFDFTPPREDILRHLKQRGVLRCFLQHSQAKTDEPNA